MGNRDTDVVEFGVLAGVPVKEKKLLIEIDLIYILTLNFCTVDPGKNKEDSVVHRPPFWTGYFSQ